VTARVLGSPGVYSAYGTNIDDPAGNGILGGGLYPDGASPPFADDFTHQFTASNGRLTGTVSGLTDADCPGGGGECEPVASNPPDADVDFPWFAPNQNTGACVNGICTVTDATVTQEDTPTTFTGTAVSKPGFFSYQLISTPTPPTEQNPDPDGPETLLVFGGTPYTFPDQGTGELRKFDLTGDVGQTGAAGPFMSANSSPVLAEGDTPATVTPLMLLDKDPDPAGGPEENTSRRVWLQSSFSMTGSGTSQQSSINVALGEWDPDTGLTGARRGGSHVDIEVDTGNENCDGPCPPVTNRESYAFTGDIASLSGPDDNNSHFLGTDNPNVVVGLDSTGTDHNIGRDTPLDPESTDLQNQVGATYHVGVGGDAVPNMQSLQGEKKGYAAGIVESKVPTGTTFVNVVASTSPDDMTVNFDPDSNTLKASITVRDVQHHDGATDAYTFGFGDDPSNPEAPRGRSAYIDDRNYAAIENGTSQVSYYDYSNDYGLSSNYQQPQLSAYEYSEATSYFVNGDQLGVTKYFPETFGPTAEGADPPPFCTGCEFIEWGAWGSRVAFGNEGDPENPEYVDDVHMGWWVAGDLTDPAFLADADNWLALGPTASYSGHVIGDVANNLDGTGWTTYTATGDLAMNWDFANQNGDLTISNFDSRSYSTGEGGLTQPSLDVNQFGGSLHQIDGPSINNISGSVTGSFVDNGDIRAAGVMGNWNLNSQNYKATGIFAGVR
jgi:hypothetical protein